MQLASSMHLSRPIAIRRSYAQAVGWRAAVSRPRRQVKRPIDHQLGVGPGWGPALACHVGSAYTRAALCTWTTGTCRPQAANLRYCRDGLQTSCSFLRQCAAAAYHTAQVQHSSVTPVPHVMDGGQGSAGSSRGIAALLTLPARPENAFDTPGAAAGGAGGVLWLQGRGRTSHAPWGPQPPQLAREGRPGGRVAQEPALRLVRTVHTGSDARSRSQLPDVQAVDIFRPALAACQERQQVCCVAPCTIGPVVTSVQLPEGAQQRGVASCSDRRNVAPANTSQAAHAGIAGDFAAGSGQPGGGGGVHHRAPHRRQREEPGGH